MGDYGLSSWETFTADPARAETDYLGGETCAVPMPAATQMGLSAGWLDVYSHTTFGNYIDFADNPDGAYVIRATADGAHTINESDVTDNVSYPHIRVTGDLVDVLQRSRGDDPWDADAVIVVDGRQGALADPKCVPSGPCP